MRRNNNQQHRKEVKTGGHIRSAECHDHLALDPMIKVIQANYRASEDIMTALMSAAIRAGAQVVLIQEPRVEEEEDWWREKIKDGNYTYIYSDDVKNHT
jgi:hypothetical protein